MPDPHDLVANILASRNICEDNGQIVYNIYRSRDADLLFTEGVVFLQPIQNEASEISVKRVQGKSLSNNRANSPKPTTHLASTEHNLDTQSTMDEDFQRALVPVSSVDGILERTERETYVDGSQLNATSLKCNYTGNILAEKKLVSEAEHIAFLIYHPPGEEPRGKI